MDCYQRLANDRQGRDEGRRGMRVADDDVAGAANHHTAMAGGAIERMAFRPLMNTVEENPPFRAWPQVHVSLTRAAARPLKKTSGEPLAIGLVPWPGRGQVVGSVRRAAGFPDICIPCHCQLKRARDANHQSSVRQPLNTPS